MLVPLAYLIVYMYKLVNSLMVIIVPHRIIWSWYTGHWRVAYDEGTGHAGPQPAQSVRPAQSLIAVPNATAHPSTASVPITVLLYNGLLLCGFNVLFKGLISMCQKHSTQLYFTINMTVEKNQQRYRIPSCELEWLRWERPLREVTSPPGECGRRCPDWDPTAGRC